MVSEAALKNVADGKTSRAVSGVAGLGFCVVGLGLGLWGSVLPGGLGSGQGAVILRWCQEIGVPDLIASVAVGIYRFRMWLGIGLIDLGCLGDHFLG